MAAPNIERAANPKTKRPIEDDFSYTVRCPDCGWERPARSRPQAEALQTAHVCKESK